MKQTIVAVGELVAIAFVVGCGSSSAPIPARSPEAEVRQDCETYEFIASKWKPQSNLWSYVAAGTGAGSGLAALLTPSDDSGQAKAGNAITISLSLIALGAGALGIYANSKATEATSSYEKRNCAAIVNNPPPPNRVNIDLCVPEVTACDEQGNANSCEALSEKLYKSNRFVSSFAAAWYGCKYGNQTSCKRAFNLSDLEFLEKVEILRDMSTLSAEDIPKNWDVLKAKMLQSQWVCPPVMVAPTTTPSSTNQPSQNPAPTGS